VSTGSGQAPNPGPADGPGARGPAGVAAHVDPDQLDGHAVDTGASPPPDGWHGAARGGPPGSGIFSLDGRPAPGLYVVSWLLALTGIGLFVVAGGAASSSTGGGPAGGVAVALLFGAFVVLTLACASAAGYQVLARADRPVDRYRGPSPLILFGLILFGVTLLVGFLSAAGLIAPESQSLGALVDVVATAGAYVGAIWLFVVRTGSLDWRSMGWPAGWRRSAARLTGDVMSGVAIIVPTYIVTILLGGAIAALLGAQLPATLPTPRSLPDALATVVAGVIVAPIGEESFFRGLSLTAWWRDLGLRSALLRSTLFFAAAHILNVTATNAGDGLRTAALQFVVILPVGFVLGWLFAQRGIVASIAGHMAFNAIAVALLLGSGSIRV
jgi:membrane protease YdiL (CAAX protease family)